MKFFEQNTPIGATASHEAPSPQPRGRVLSVGDDTVLLNSRTLILRHAGYYVQSSSSQEVLTVMRRDVFDMVLICRSVSSDRGVAIAKAIRTGWPTTVIRLAPLRDGDDEVYDFAIDMSAGPVSFLRTLGNVRFRNFGEQR